MPFDFGGGLSSYEFKEQLIEKALQRKDGESLKFIAENENVGLSTLTRWMKESRDVFHHSNTEFVYVRSHFLWYKIHFW